MKKSNLLKGLSVIGLLLALAACGGDKGGPGAGTGPGTGEAATGEPAPEGGTIVPGGTGTGIIEPRAASPGTAPEEAGGSGASACIAETDLEFCARLVAGANCGSVTGTDNCGTIGTVASCGTCVDPTPVCVANICVAGVPGGVIIPVPSPSGSPDSILPGGILPGGGIGGSLDERCRRNPELCRRGIPLPGLVPPPPAGPFPPPPPGP